MEQDEQIMAKLLYDRECPVGFQCLDMNCIECVKKHMERGEDHEQSQNPGLSETIHTQCQS